MIKIYCFIDSSGIVIKFIVSQMDVAVSPETHKELLIGSIELRYTESALPFFSPDFLDSKDSMGKVILQSSFPSMNRQQYHQDYFALLLRSHPSAHQCKVSMSKSLN